MLEPPFHERRWPMATKKKAKKKAKKKRRKVQRLTDSFCEEVEDELDQLDSDIEGARDDFRSGVDAVEEVEEASNDMRDAIKRRDPVALEEARNALIKALDDNSHYLDNFTNGYADDVRCEAEGVLDTTDEVETEDGQPVAKKKAKKKAKRRR
jgi:hypothetical protein